MLADGMLMLIVFFFFSSRRRHTRCSRDWSSDVCSSDLSGADFSRLRELAPDDLAAHWQLVLRFLDILPKAWPGMLSAEGALDAAERRNLLLRRQAVLWRPPPPRDPGNAARPLGRVSAPDR